MLQARILLWAPVTLCGAFQEAGKGPLSKGCVFPWVPAPLGSLCDATPLPPAVRGSLGLDTMALTWGPFSMKRLALCTQKHNEALGFKVIVFLRKLCIWDSSTLCPAPRWVS